LYTVTNSSSCYSSCCCCCCRACTTVWWWSEATHCWMVSAIDLTSTSAPRFLRYVGQQQQQQSLVHLCI